MCIIVRSLQLVFLILKFPRLSSSQYPFPNFDLQAPPQIAEQVAVDNPNIGVHVWNLANALNRSFTIEY